MPVITGPHNNADIFLSVGIIDADAIDFSDPSVQLGHIPSPPLFKALIDTGAQKTMISPHVITTLGLQPRGKILVSSVGPQAHYHNGYLFHVAFVTPSTVPSLGLAGLVHVQRDAIYGAEIPSTGGLFDVLLGMDVLTTGLLVVQNGQFSFSY
jgi:gag-polyprotein putative aspartyl protease